MAHFAYTGLRKDLPEVRESAFYLCTDTRELYFGENLFTEAVRPYSGDKPTTPAIGVLYVNTDTGVGEFYTGTEWIPVIGGNSDADDVYFTNDLIFTYQFGKYSPVGGKVTVPANGKSLTELFEDAYAEDQIPSIAQPSVTLTSSQVKAYEVGTEVTPSYSASLVAGSYEYGPATGVVVTAWAVTNTDGGSLTTATGTFDEITVEDDTDYDIVAKATHSAGAVPKTALGNDYDEGKIAIGTKQATKTSITGYRNTFYGTLTSKDGGITSDLVRSLPMKTNNASGNGNSISVAVPVGAIRVMFAYPATLRDVTSVQDINGMNAEIKSAFTQNIVSVDGVNEYVGKDYKVYVMDMASANDTANTYKVTI